MPPKAKNKSIVKNFKKGRTHAKNKGKHLSNTSTNIKKSHGKAGGNIKYTGGKNNNRTFSTQTSEEREAVKERILARRLAREALDAGGPKVVLPSDFKEKKHLSLADELANFGNDSQSDSEIELSESESQDDGDYTPMGRNKSIRNMLKPKSTAEDSDTTSDQMSLSDSFEEENVDDNASENAVKEIPKKSKEPLIKQFVPKKGTLTKKRNNSKQQKEILDNPNNSSRGVLANRMSEQHVQMSIKILKRIDPNQKLPKDKLITTIGELQEQSEDLLIVETCGFLLESLENMEEKLEEEQIRRTKQEKKLKAKRIDGKVFKMKISLDLDSDEEPEPDENDRIYCTGKKIYSGKHSLYLKPDKKQKKDVLKKIKPKKMNAKLAEKYNLS